MTTAQMMNEVRNTPKPPEKKTYPGRKISVDGKFEMQGYTFQIDETSEELFEADAIYRFVGQKPNSKTVEYLVEKLAADRTGTQTYLTCNIIGAAPKADSAQTATRPASNLVQLDASKEFLWEGVRYRIAGKEGRLTASTSRRYRFFTKHNLPYIVEIRDGQESKYELLCEPINPPESRVQGLAPQTQNTPQSVRPQAYSPSLALASVVTSPQHPAHPDQSTPRPPHVAHKPSALPGGAFFLPESGRFESHGVKLRVLEDDLHQLDLSLPVIYRGKQKGEEDIFVVEQLTAEGLKHTPPRLAYCIAYLMEPLSASQHDQSDQSEQKWWKKALSWAHKAIDEAGAKAFGRWDDQAVDVTVTLSAQKVKDRMYAAGIALPEDHELTSGGDKVIVRVIRRHQWAAELVLKKYPQIPVQDLVTQVRWNTRDENRQKEVRRTLASNRIAYVEKLDLKGVYHVWVENDNRYDETKYKGKYGNQTGKRNVNRARQVLKPIPD